jgi:hypothetical protein
VRAGRERCGVATPRPSRAAASLRFRSPPRLAQRSLLSPGVNASRAALLCAALALGSARAGEPSTPGLGCSPFVVPASASADEVADLVERCTRSLRPGADRARRLAAPIDVARADAADVARAEPGEAGDLAPLDPARCALQRGGSDLLPSRECLRCHRPSGPTHPFDVDYERARARRPHRLRPAGEATARGAFLPDGEVRCVTCHSAASPWKHHVALPPGARTMGLVPFRERGVRRPSDSPLPGDAVEPTPLCIACHTAAD